MSDLISREMAIDALRNKAPDKESVDDLIAIIKELPSVMQKSETVTEFADRCRECGARYGKLLRKWIPVSERLPKDGQSVLFCDIDDDIMLGYHVKGRPDTHFSQDGTFEDIKNVRAWMPLPKPYEPLERSE